MLLSDIKSTAAAYHDKTSADFTVSGLDLFLVAANNARKAAERLHNFNNARIRGTISVPGSTGVSLATASIEGQEITLTGVTTPATAGTYTLLGNVNGLPAWRGSGGVSAFFIYYNSTLANYTIGTAISSAAPSIYWVKASDNFNPLGTYNPGAGAASSTVATATNLRISKWKEITAASRTSADGSAHPIDFTRSDIALERDRYELELSDDFWPTNRYPSDADFLSNSAASTLVQLGNSLYIHPRDTTVTSSLEIDLEGFGWMNDYTATDLTATSPVDFFCEFGGDWLLWCVIIEANYRWKTFVPRTEGNLAPPEQARAEAWRDLLLWDSYLVDSNVTRSR